MKKYNKLITLLLVIIVLSLYMIGVNFYNRIDRFDDETLAQPSYADNDDIVLNTKKININKASVEELVELENIGRVKAEKIIEKRNELGGFSSIEDLLTVEGIGEGILDDIRDEITLE